MEIIAKKNTLDGNTGENIQKGMRELLEVIEKQIIQCGISKL